MRRGCRRAGNGPCSAGCGTRPPARPRSARPPSSAEQRGRLLRGPLTSLRQSRLRRSARSIGRCSIGITTPTTSVCCFVIFRSGASECSTSAAVREGFAIRLAQLSDKVDAMDRSERMITAAKQRTPPGVNCVLGDVVVDDLPARDYDAIVSITALHHMPLEVVLPRLADALRPGGVLTAIALPRGRPEARMADRDCRRNRTSSLGRSVPLRGERSVSERAIRRSLTTAECLS